jgi:hypothetical protein
LTAASYPFLDVLWSMVVFFVWILWFMLLFKVFGDIFRRDDLSGSGKTGWIIFTILLPFLGVFVYLITQNDGMTRREVDRMRARRVQSGGGGAATDIEKAKQLLDGGAITQAEFDAIKRRALA